MIEAIEEGERVSVYFKNDDQARTFVKTLANIKEKEMKGFGFD
jgi:hypothetical protein